MWYIQLPLCSKGLIFSYVCFTWYQMKCLPFLDFKCCLTLSHFQGVLVEEVDEGQPCLTCHEKCSGFAPHMWRWVHAYLYDCFVWDFGQTTNGVCSSFKLLRHPRILCYFETFLGRCVIYSILYCSYKTEGVNTILSVRASCIIGVVKKCNRKCHAHVLACPESSSEYRVAKCTVLD
jgi:hypothetical protein